MLGVTEKNSVSERILKNGDRISILDYNTLHMGTGFDCFHEALLYDIPNL